MSVWHIITFNSYVAAMHAKKKTEENSADFSLAFSFIYERRIRLPVKSLNLKLYRLHVRVESFFSQHNS